MMHILDEGERDKGVLREHRELGKRKNDKLFEISELPLQKARNMTPR